MTRQQAYALMVECVKEVQKRLVLNLPNFGVVVVDKDGIHNMDTINHEVIAKAA
jgi:20S proteasome subunit beta 4